MTKTGGEDLLLIPTEIERDEISRHMPNVDLQLCGFGPIAAAARTAQLIAERRPSRIILLGIAGTYDVDQLPVGAASRFHNISCLGIGAGEGAAQLGPRQLKLAQVQIDGRDVFDQIQLKNSSAAAQSRQLLTVCSASADASEVAERRRRFPSAVAEDMEAFGVALACKIADTCLVVVRGISNIAGDRDHHHWHIAPALKSAARLVHTELFSSFKQGG